MDIEATHFIFYRDIGALGARNFVFQFLSYIGCRLHYLRGNIILDSLKVTFTDDKILNKVIIR